MGSRGWVQEFTRSLSGRPGTALQVEGMVRATEEWQCVVCLGNVCCYHMVGVSGLGPTSCLEATQSCLCDSLQWGKGLSVLKQGFSVIIPVITRGPGIGEKVSSEWSYLGRSEETWARLQSSGELKGYYPPCILWTSVALAFMQGSFCLAENTCKYLESQPEGRATDTKRVEARDAAKHQTIYKTVPHNRGLSGPRIPMVPMLRNPIGHAAIWLQLAGFCLTITIPFLAT